MAHIDFKNKTITAKLVYYGCGLCGKTRNLEYINEQSSDTTELMALATEGDRTIFFDFLPMSLGTIRGVSTQFKLYAVPGQVRYNMTRRLVLKDVDGIVFVVDSQPAMLRANRDSLANLFDNLSQLGIPTDEVPIVVQYNKRDLPGVLPIEQLESEINAAGYRSFAASALTGEGVFETLDSICKLVFDRLWQQMAGGPPIEPTEILLDEVEEVTAVGPPPLPVVEAPAPPPPAAPETQKVEQHAARVPQVEPEVAPEVNVILARLAAVAKPLDEIAELLAPLERLTAAAESVEKLVGLADGVERLCATTGSLEAIAALTPSFEQIASVSGDLEALASPQPPLENGVEKLVSFGEHQPTAASSSGWSLTDVQQLASLLRESLGDLGGQPGGDGTPSDEPGASTETLARLRREQETREAAYNEARAAQLRAEKRVLELERELRQRKLDWDRERRQLQRATPEGPPEGQARAMREEVEREAEARRAAEERVRQLTADLRRAREESPRFSNDEPGAEADKEARVLRPDQPPIAPEEDDESSGAEPPATARQSPEQQPEIAPPTDQASQAPTSEAPRGHSGEETSERAEIANARRIARVIVGDLVLYHRDIVDQVLDGGELEELLAEPLAEARKTFASRVSSDIEDAADYLEGELRARLESLGQRRGRRTEATNGPPAEEAAPTAAAEADAQSPQPATAEPEEERASQPDALGPEEERAPEPAGDQASQPSTTTPAPVNDDPRHASARRVARVMVADLVLYHRDAIHDGIANDNLEEALAEALGEARKTYAGRVPEDVRSACDYFELEWGSRLDSLREQQSAEPEPTARSGTTPEAAAPAAAAKEAKAPPSEESSDTTADPETDPHAGDEAHAHARRVARVMVADLFLYHRDVIADAIENGNLEQTLEEPLGEARKTFEARVSEEIRKQRDYFAIELEERLREHTKSASTG